MLIFHGHLIQSYAAAAAAAAKSLQSCLTLCDPRDDSPPGSPVPGILQARTLEQVAISFSNAWKWKVKVKSLSRVRLLATPWTAAYRAPPSMGFSRQEYWSGVPLPSPINALIPFKWRSIYHHNGDTSQNNVTSEVGCRLGRGLRNDEVFYVLIQAVITQVYTCTKIHWAVHSWLGHLMCFNVYIRHHKE